MSSSPTTTSTPSTAEKHFVYTGQDKEEIPDDVRAVVVDPSVSTIKEGAFYFKRQLNKVNITSGVTAIESGAFAYCNKLEEVTLPDTLTHISDKAFQYCSSLTSIELPTTSLTHIGEGAFGGCHKLDKSTIQQISDIHSNLRHNLVLQHGPGPQHGFEGTTQQGWGPNHWAITIEQMEEIKNHPFYYRNITMRDAVNFIIKPITAGAGVGYALLKNQKQPLHAAVMVSHAWDEELCDFIGCLKDSGKTGPFWVCAFGIYQNDGDDDMPTIVQQLGPNPERGPFATVLAGADSMVAVVTKTCDIYTRLWCVYEMYVAQSLGTSVKLCPHMYDEAIEMGYLDFDACIDNIETPVDSESAFCFNESDRESIHKAIRSERDGFEGINQGVENIRLEYLFQYPVHKIKTGRRHAIYLLVSKLHFNLSKTNPSSSRQLASIYRSTVILICFAPTFAFQSWTKKVKSLLQKNKSKETTNQSTTPEEP